MRMMVVIKHEPFLHVLLLSLLLAGLRGRSTLGQGSFSSIHVFDVKSFGARADGLTDDTSAFKAAWLGACNCTGKASIIVPKGVYLIGPIRFTGPCRYSSSLVLQIKGYLKATTDLSRYKHSGGGWLEFKWLNRLILTGRGTLDGQGLTAWPFNKCSANSSCQLLPMNLKFVAMNKTVIRGITSLNSKSFHIAVVDCRNFRGSHLNISAPETSPNTDGIHIDRSSSVYFSSSFIGTGDDCISVGQGNSQITITSITCGPGHGISVGSLGRYPHEEDVSGLVVRDCIMKGTTNGIRIKTWPNSPGQSAAKNITFENIVMNNVSNPIIIDQTYCPLHSCTWLAPSRVKLSDIYFKNISGTSSSAVAVTLECSRRMPCQNVYMQDVHLELSSKDEHQNEHPTSLCKYVQVRYIGTQLPPPCQLD